MKNISRKIHWEKIYQSRPCDQVSWYQEKPDISLEILNKFNLPKTAKIIDLGGGDSVFVDYLLKYGYQDITVLDISEIALARAKKRLGIKAQKVKWIISDIADFKPNEKYDLWHDRAAFHFLTQEKDISFYIENVRKFIKPEGYLVVGTFSENGPEKCSGLKINQYSKKSLADRFLDFFEKINCRTVIHMTPSKIVQEFVFCSFMKMANT